MEVAESSSQSIAVGSTLTPPRAGGDDLAAVLGLPRRPGEVGAEPLAAAVVEVGARAGEGPRLAVARVDLHADGVGLQVQLVAFGHGDGAGNAVRRCRLGDEQRRCRDQSACAEQAGERRHVFLLGSGERAHARRAAGPPQRETFRPPTRGIRPKIGTATMVPGPRAALRAVRSRSPEDGDDRRAGRARRAGWPSARSPACTPPRPRAGRGPRRCACSSVSERYEVALRELRRALRHGARADALSLRASLHLRIGDLRRALEDARALARSVRAARWRRAAPSRAWPRRSSSAATSPRPRCCSRTVPSRRRPARCRRPTRPTACCSPAAGCGSSKAASTTRSRT